MKIKLLILLGVVINSFLCNGQASYSKYEGKYWDGYHNEYIFLKSDGTWSHYFYKPEMPNTDIIESKGVFEIINNHLRLYIDVNDKSKYEDYNFNGKSINENVTGKRAFFKESEMQKAGLKFLGKWVYTSVNITPDFDVRITQGGYTYFKITAERYLGDDKSWKGNLNLINDSLKGIIKYPENSSSSSEVVISYISSTVLKLKIGPNEEYTLNKKGVKAKSNSTDFTATKDTVKSQVVFHYDLIRVNIPNSNKLINAINVSGLSYNKAYLNTNFSGTYFTKFANLFLLGVACSDWSYTAFYKQKQDMNESCNKITALIPAVGVSEIKCSEYQIDYLNNSIDFQPRLEEDLNRIERNLRSNQRTAGCVILISGSWIEGLYLATEAAVTNATAINSKDFYSQISYHCSSLEYLLQLLEAYASNPDCSKLLKEIQPLKNILLQQGKKIDANNISLINNSVKTLRNKILI